MKVGWPQLLCTPDAEALDLLSASWGDFIGEQYTPLLFSAFGDMFYQTSMGIFWLDLGAREITRIADTPEQFQSLLATHHANEWFLPPLVEQLYAAHKIPQAGYCYSPTILPVFAEGKYTVSNLNPVPVKEHFVYTASVHSQLANLPNGAKVRIVVTE